jgi:hypothetical protein
VYPPIFFAVAVPLALLPYSVAYGAWALGTLAGYFAVVKRIFRENSAAIAFGLAPACLSSFLIAQNGMFTAALFGGALLTLTTRPTISGLFVAALAYKPQFAAILPLALVAGGHWRAMLVAVVVTVTWLSLALTIDPATIPAFVHALGIARNDLLAVGTEDLHKLQSVYGYLRLAGVSDAAATTAQAAIAVTCGVVTIFVWRKSLPFEAKAAATLLLALLATPYAFIYDYPLLAVAGAFLYRERRFDRGEVAAIWAAYALNLTTLFTGVPLGIPAVALVGAILVRRTTGAANLQHATQGLS